MLKKKVVWNLSNSHVDLYFFYNYILVIGIHYPKKMTDAGGIEELGEEAHEEKRQSGAYLILLLMSMFAIISIYAIKDPYSISYFPFVCSIVIYHHCIIGLHIWLLFKTMDIITKKGKRQWCRCCAALIINTLVIDALIVIKTSSYIH